MEFYLNLREHHSTPNGGTNHPNDVPAAGTAIAMHTDAARHAIVMSTTGSLRSASDADCAGLELKGLLVLGELVGVTVGLSDGDEGAHEPSWVAVSPRK